MSRRVIVSFGRDGVFALPVSPAALDAMDADEARAWLAAAFEAFGCEPSNPMGKVLPVDLILGVARAAGAARFAQDADWAECYACAVACLRSEPAIEVDVAGFVVRQHDAVT